jgi:hypothetical protein
VAIVEQGIPLNSTAIEFDDVGLSSSATVQVPTLREGAQCVTIVRATDKRGLVSECASDGFRTDFSPPSPGTVDTKLGKSQPVRVSPTPQLA